MSQFNPLFPPTNFKSPAEEKAYDEERLVTLASGMALMAVFKAEAKKLAVMIAAFLLFPSLFFHLATFKLAEDASQLTFGLLGVGAWFAGGVLAYFLTRNIASGDPSEQLAKSMKSLQAAEDAHAKKWNLTPKKFKDS